MDALCIDIRAPYATFRVPSTTRGYTTFPVPPRTTILGLIGGIMGVERNEAFFPDHFLYNTKIAIQLINKATTVNFRTNQMQTRYLYSEIGKGVKIYIPWKSKRGVRSPQNLILLKDVHYRIFINFSDRERFQELEFRIKEHKYIYPPYLGRANYLASVAYIDTLDITEVVDKENSTEIISICSSDSIKEIRKGEFTIVTNVPMGYKATRSLGEIKLEPNKLINIVYSLSPLTIIPSVPYYRIHRSTVEELQNKNLVFLPCK